MFCIVKGYLRMSLDVPGNVVIGTDIFEDILDVPGCPRTCWIGALYSVQGQLRISRDALQYWCILISKDKVEDILGRPKMFQGMLGPVRQCVAILHEICRGQSGTVRGSPGHLWQFSGLHCSNSDSSAPDQ